RFDLGLGLTAQGDTVVGLANTIDTNGPGGSVEGFGPSYTLTGLGNGYHTYSLLYSPASHLADLSVDGVIRIQGYAGTTESLSDPGFNFLGLSGGQANFNFVQFSSVPEPPSMILLGVGGVLMVLRAYHRRQIATST